MVKHTPGPWRAVVRSNQYGLQVAAVDMPPHTSWRPSKQHKHVIPAYEEANARLIAAAPDLLAALEWAEMHLAPFCREAAYDDGKAKMRDAIAKARNTEG